MTTKQKIRKPAAKPAKPKIAATVASSEPKREVSKIYALVSRWKWLKADADYQAATADTEEKSERLITIHDAEQEKIGEELATLIPETFWDAMKLLEFATKLAKGGWDDDLGIDMLENVRTGLRAIWLDEMEAERERARVETTAEVRRSIEIAFACAEVGRAARRKERAAA